MPRSLHLVGKRAGRSPIVASAAGHNESLLFAWDSHSGRRFLVNTGAESQRPASHRPGHTHRAVRSLAQGSQWQLHQDIRSTHHQIMLCITPVRVEIHHRRRSPSVTRGCSAAELVYGTPLTVPGISLPTRGTNQTTVSSCSGCGTKWAH